MANEVKPGWRNTQPIRKESITVQHFYDVTRERFKLTQLAGAAGLTNLITDKSLHRPGLALAGYVGLFTYHRIQIFGNTEIFYLKSLPLEERIKVFSTLASFAIPCIVVTSGNMLDPELYAICDERNIPIFETTFETTKAVYFLSDFLEDQFNPQTVIHGAFVDVYGVGVLFVGRSGIGKSEVALDLIERGHRLVADDVVMVTQKGENILMGAGTDLVRHFMEIRGLGLINVREMFGIRAIRFQKRVEVIVELEEWQPDGEYTRTGLDESTAEILGIDLPHVKLPIITGKNITVIAEVIALNYLLKHYGYDASREFANKLDQILMKKGNTISGGDRVIPYFEHDFE
ncbi:MAG TPA: HPr(Ser) kinase/phosphatase [Candidatus Kapabacteria bacterium]|jgi:HPr kinase/phosphorylase|nr:HPr(Ser) kinase/phosphatase [Candidatus Kapabacteria bacterium]